MANFGEHHEAVDLLHVVLALLVVALHQLFGFETYEQPVPPASLLNDVDIVVGLDFFLVLFFVLFLHLL